MGFEDRDALLPYGARSLQGYRLLHEYFAFPDRYMFAEIGGLSPALRRCKAAEIDVVILLDKGDITLQNVLDPGNFVPQQYLPAEITGTVLFDPQQNAAEESIRQRLRQNWKDRYNY